MAESLIQDLIFSLIASEPVSWLVQVCFFSVFLVLAPVDGMQQRQQQRRRALAIWLHRSTFCNPAHPILCAIKVGMPKK